MSNEPKVDLAGVDELVGRLRAQRPEGEPISVARLMDAAADTIQSLIATAREAEALRAENARLRDTIKTFNDVAVRKGKSMISSIARAALEQGEVKHG